MSLLDVLSFYLYTKVSLNSFSSDFELYGTISFECMTRCYSVHAEDNLIRRSWNMCLFSLKLMMHSVSHCVKLPTAIIIIYKCKIVRHQPHSHNSPSSELCLIKEQTIINHSWNNHNEKKYDVHTYINDERMFQEWERMWKTEAQKVLW